jgi:hypothetical protein
MFQKGGFAGHRRLGPVMFFALAAAKTAGLRPAMAGLLPE